MKEGNLEIPTRNKLNIDLFCPPRCKALNARTFCSFSNWNEFDLLDTFVAQFLLSYRAKTFLQSKNFPTKQKLSNLNSSNEKTILSHLHFISDEKPPLTTRTETS